MSYKVFFTGNYGVVEYVAGKIVEAPAKDCVIKRVATSVYDINIGGTIFENMAFADITDINGVAYVSTAVFEAAYRTSTGGSLSVVYTGTGAFSGDVTVAGTTASTTKDTGSIVTEGGIGVEKAIFAGLGITAGTTLKAGDGTVSLPGIGFTTDPDSGLYVIGANNLGLALNGAKVVDFKTAGIGVEGRIVKRPIGTTVAANSGVTLTAAMMVSGYVEVTGTTGSLVLDSVANITTALGTSPAGTTFDFTLNTKGATPMTATNVVTLTAPASCIFMKQFNTTDVATPFIPTVTATDGLHVGTFRVTYQTATTIVVQRIG